MYSSPLHSSPLYGRPPLLPEREHTPPAAGQDRLSVIIVNYNTAHLLERCLGTLRAACADVDLEVVIVDNASRDGSAAFIKDRFPWVTLIANAQNVGFGRANNQALAACSAPLILLLNADAYVFPDTIRKSLAHMQREPACGVLGAHLVDEHGSGVFSGRTFPSSWQTFLLRTGLLARMRRSAPDTPPPPAASGTDALEALDCDWVVGCYYLVRRSLIDQIGLFDPRYFLYYEEVDHCQATHAAGWRVQCLTQAQVIHVGGGSAETEGTLAVGRQISELQQESGLLYFRKHQGLAGVWTHAALGVLTEWVLAVKFILKRRRLSGLSAFERPARSLCRLMLRTRAGSRPTR